MAHHLLYIRQGNKLHLIAHRKRRGKKKKKKKERKKTEDEIKAAHIAHIIVKE